MVSKMSLIAVIVPLLCFIKSSAGDLTCYSCQEFTTIANPRNVQSSASSSSSSSASGNPYGVSVVPCGELTDTETIKCQSYQNACIKTVLPTGETGQRLVHRKCGTTSDCENAGTQTNNIQCYSCKGNKCNGSSSLTVAVILLALPAALFIKMH